MPGSKSLPDIRHCKHMPVTGSLVAGNFMQAMGVRVRGRPRGRGGP
jgi:hypothetical protein